MNAKEIRQHILTNKASYFDRKYRFLGVPMTAEYNISKKGHKILNRLDALDNYAMMDMFQRASAKGFIRYVVAK